MEAAEVFSRLQPPGLIVEDGVSPDARKYINQVESVQQEGAARTLDALAAAIQDLRTTDDHYPVLALRMANAYFQAKEPNAARDQLTSAMEILGRQTGAACQQNKAVALLYQGLVLHSMAEHKDALHRYEEARNQFRDAARNWQRSSSGLARAMQCEIAADRLQDCVQKELDTIVPSKASVPTPSAWKPKDIPKPPQAPARQSPAPPAMFSTAMLAALGVIVCLLIITIVLIAYYLGGRIALISTAAALVSMAAVAIVTGLSYTQGGLFLRVPRDYAAVIEQNGALFEVQPGQAQVLIPWVSRLHSLVPVKKLTFKPPKQKVSLGRNPSGANSYVSLTIQIDYRVLSSIDATSLTGGLSAANGDHKGVWTEEELKTNWQARLQNELSPLLANHMWGATEGDCCAHRERLQADLRNDLTQETRLWGIEVENLTILDVSSA